MKKKREERPFRPEKIPEGSVVSLLLWKLKHGKGEERGDDNGMEGREGRNTSEDGRGKR